MVRLDLSYNEISLRGVLVIAQALEDNDRLEVLGLNGNRCGVCAGVHTSLFSVRRNASPSVSSRRLALTNDKHTRGARACLFVFV